MHAISELEKLGAVKNGKITTIGKKMAQYPLEPKLARLLLYGHEYKTMSEVLNIVACLSADHIFNHYGGSIIDHNQNTSSSSKKSSGKSKTEKLSEIKLNQSKFYKPEGDCITLLEVYRSFNKHNKDKNKQFEFTKDHDLNFRNLKNAGSIRRQLREISQSLELDWESSRRDDLKVAQKCCYWLRFGFFRK